MVTPSPVLSHEGPGMLSIARATIGASETNCLRPSWPALMMFLIDSIGSPASRLPVA